MYRALSSMNAKWIMDLSFLPFMKLYNGSIWNRRIVSCGGRKKRGGGRTVNYHCVNNKKNASVIAERKAQTYLTFQAEQYPLTD